MAMIENKSAASGFMGLGRASGPGRAMGGRAMGAGALTKAVFDRTVAFVALVLLAPLMLGIAAAIRLSTGDKVLFAHRRVGAGGRSFDCLKFRSMVPDAQERLKQILATDPIAREEWEEDFKFERDSRVTRVGRVLRKTSLDELPQLLNVLRGDMSLVGPRPVTEAETKRYGHHYEAYKLVRPGLTGLWQVSGRSDTTYEERIALDVRYIRTASFATDIGILFKTVWCVLARRGAV